MIRLLINLPILKRLIPSIGIKILKLLDKNKGFYKINDIFFYLDFLDPIDRKIILHNEYENDAISFLQNKFIQYSVSNFLDIGANCGYYSFYFAKKFKNLRVKAYEPNFEAIDKFKKTLTKNSFKNIEVFNYGLSDTKKKVKMITWYKHGYAKTNSVILDHTHDVNNSKIFETDLKVGDELLNYNNQIICIKIDVEGHELNVLKGLIRNLKKNKCIILVESGDAKFTDVNDFLIKNSYKQIFKSKYRMDFVYSNL
jgi:FkbM family methyltransferase